MSKSLADTYKTKCSALSVKCNSGIVRLLEETNPSEKHLTLDGNVVGPRGLLAFLDVAVACTGLVSLNLRGNNLNSACIKDLCAVALTHPTLRHLNLGDNDIRLAGPDLVDLVKRNHNIIVLNIDNTYLRPLFVRLLEIQVARNLAAASPADVQAATKVPGAKTFLPAAKPAASGKPNQPPAAAAAAAKLSQPAAADVAPQEGDAAFVSGFAFGEEDPAPAEEAPFGQFSAFGAPASPNSHDGPRNVHVSDKVEVMSSASELQGTLFKRTAGRRPTVSAEVYTEDEVSNFKPTVIPKEESVRQELMKILEKNNLFSHLEDYELCVAVDQMQDSTRCAGDNIYDEGDEDGDTFYVVLKGEINLMKAEKQVQVVKAGECFADVMLLYSGTYEHTATCATACTIYSLIRPAYKFILTQSSKKKRAKYEGFLQSIGFLKGLNKLEILQLADALKSKQFEAGQSLITYGEVGEHFYIVCEGKVEVIGRDEKKQPKWVCDFTVGDCVGELEFLNNHKCVADVKAKTALRVAMMNRHHFEMVMGPVKDVLSRIANESTVYEYYRQQLAAMNK